MGVNKNKKTIWLCQCDCGSDPKILMGKVLKSKAILSCGCIRKNQYKTHGLTYTPLYKVWCGMKGRCSNENNKGYNDYGGRGIKICDEWVNDFETFYNWAIENGFKKGLVIDRKNNDMGYFPNNCHWVTQMENNKIGKRRKRVDNKSGCAGVSKNRNKWIAYININNVRINIGTFETKELAIEARLKKEKELIK